MSTDNSEYEMNKRKETAREWWVHPKATDRNISGRYPIYSAVDIQPENPGWVPVIEKSAFTTLEQRLAKRDEDNTAIANMAEKFAEERDALQSKLERAEQEAKDNFEKYRDAATQRTEFICRLAAAEQMLERMADALNLGVTDEHGEATHLGKYIDHKDCDSIRDALSAYAQYVAEGYVELEGESAKKHKDAISSFFKAKPEGK